MNHTTSKHRKTNRILMAASLLLALTPLVQAGQITWGLQDVTIGRWNDGVQPNSTVTGSFVWDTSLNSGFGGVASAHIDVFYLNHTLDINTADGATFNYIGINSTSHLMSDWEIIATNAEYTASGVFNGYKRIRFRNHNPPLGFSDATATQFAVGVETTQPFYLSFGGNGCCDYATAGSFVNLDLVNSPEPASIALAGPVLGLWFLLRRRCTA